MDFKFEQVNKDNIAQFEALCSLVIPYFHEIDSHYADREKLPDDVIIKYVQSMISKQGDLDRHLEICTINNNVIGFYHAKVDHIGHTGYIKPEYGFIMEFYIIPEYRRKGIGALMYQRIVSLFMNHDVKSIYLTTDPVTGKPFWEKQSRNSPSFFRFMKNVHTVRCFLTQKSKITMTVIMQFYILIRSLI